MHEERLTMFSSVTECRYHVSLRWVHNTTQHNTTQHNTTQHNTNTPFAEATQLNDACVLQRYTSLRKRKGQTKRRLQRNDGLSTDNVSLQQFTQTETLVTCTVLRRKLLRSQNKKHEMGSTCWTQGGHQKRTAIRHICQKTRQEHVRFHVLKAVWRWHSLLGYNSKHLWNVGLLQRDYTALCPTRLCHLQDRKRPHK
jgi:hypothetical protein